MSQRKSAAVLAACAFFAVGGLVQAAEPSIVSQPLYLDTAPAATAVPATAPATAPAFAPDSVIALGLDKVGLSKPLADAGIAITGYGEGSYTFNTRGSNVNTNEGRVFDFENDAPRMNQLELMITKGVTMADVVKNKQFQWGFTLDMQYGSDARLIHANGLNGYKSSTHPINQFDLTQAFAEFGFAVGNGLDIKVGKFVTIIGNEYINPTQNALFSHSYSFGFGIPFTHTGILATYGQSTDPWVFQAGLTRGWEQATNDDNGAIDFIGSVKYTMNDQFNIFGAATIGPEKAHNNGDYRYLFEVIPVYTPKDTPWTFTADAILGLEEHSSFSGGTAYWYGVTGYANYKIAAMDGMFTPNVRVEWFRDDGGSRTGIDASLYEFTVGCAIKPMPTHKIGANLTLRPELRYDYSNKDAFDGGRKHDQFTVALDAIFTL